MIKQQGFTLLEIILVIVITGIIFSIGSLMLNNLSKAYFTGTELNEIDWQGRIALNRLRRELRNVRSATATDLTLLPASEITFTTTTPETITYSLSGSTLMRNAQVLADGISNLNFTYAQNNARSVAATATETYYITVNFTASSGNISRDFRSTIYPRNFK